MQNAGVSTEETQQIIGENMNNEHDDPLKDIRDLLRMSAAQTAENARQIGATNQQLSRMAKEHTKEMKELRNLFKQVMRRITV